MTSWAYLGGVLVSLTAMVAVDRRWRLFLWADARRGAVVLAVGVAVFLAWDLAAISLGVYGGGGGAALSGIELAPDLPLEELFFVTFLCYLTMVLYGLVRRFRPGSQGASGG